jgi:hypothetical protein
LGAGVGVLWPAAGGEIERCRELVGFRQHIPGSACRHNV